MKNKKPMTWPALSLAIMISNQFSRPKVMGMHLGWLATRGGGLPCS